MGNADSQPHADDEENASPKSAKEGGTTGGTNNRDGNNKNSSSSAPPTITSSSTEDDMSSSENKQHHGNDGGGGGGPHNGGSSGNGRKNKQQQQQQQSRLALPRTSSMHYTNDDHVNVNMAMADLMAYLQVVANNSNQLPLTVRDDPELDRTVSTLSAEEYARKSAAFVPADVRIIAGAFTRYGRVWDLPTSQVS
jgi:hypothetical protein